MRCDQCIYWMPKSEGDQQGDCWRYPPKPLLMRVRVSPLDPATQEVINWFYSRTKKSNACGEFEEGVPGMLGEEDENAVP